MRLRGPCQACGHEHLCMASVSRPGESYWLCHEDDHSCYNDHRGRYDSLYDGKDHLKEAGT